MTDDLDLLLRLRYGRAMALLREVVTVQRANLAAIRNGTHEALPTVDFERWYTAAGALVDEVDG